MNIVADHAAFVGFLGFAAVATAVVFIALNYRPLHVLLGVIAVLALFIAILIAAAEVAA